MRIKDWDSNLKVRLFAESLINISFWMFFPFLTIFFAKEFGKDTAGFLLVLSQVFSVMANLMGGYCADRFGRKRMMVLAAFGQGLSFLVFGLANSPWLDSPLLSFITFTLAGVFGSLYWPASQAMVADVVDEKDRSHVFAVFYTSINIAVVIGPIIGAIFFADYLFHLLMIAGVICLLISFILSVWTRETVPLRPEGFEQQGQKWYSFLQSQIKDYGVIIKDRTFLLFIVAGIMGAQTFMQLDMLIPVYMKEHVQIQSLFSIHDWSFSVGGEQAFGLILAENGLLVALFTVSVTKWMDTFPERTVFIVSSMMYTVSMLWFGQTVWIWGLIFAIAAYTLGELMVAGLQQSFVSRIAPEHMRGQYFAAASLRYTIGRTIAPLSIPMTVWIGFQWTFTVLALISALTAVLYWVMFESLKKKRESY